MQARRSAKRSILGSRVCAPSPAGDGQLIPGVIQALKSENKECGGRCNLYMVMLEDGTLREYPEEEIVVMGPGLHTHGNKVQMKCREKVCNSARIWIGNVSVLCPVLAIVCAQTLPRCQ